MSEVDDAEHVVDLVNYTFKGGGIGVALTAIECLKAEVRLFGNVFGFRLRSSHFDFIVIGLGRRGTSPRRLWRGGWARLWRQWLLDSHGGVSAWWLWG